MALKIGDLDKSNLNIIWAYSQVRSFRLKFVSLPKMVDSLSNTQLYPLLAFDQHPKIEAANQCKLSQLQFHLPTVNYIKIISTCNIVKCLLDFSTGNFKSYF